MYKRHDVGPMDAVFGAADLSDLVTQLSMIKTIARSDRDVVRTVETTRRELADRAKALKADELTAEKLVGACKTELGTIRARLGERRAALDGVRLDIRRLVADAQEESSPGPASPPSSRPTTRAAAARARGGRSSRARPRATA